MDAFDDFDTGEFGQPSDTQLLNELVAGGEEEERQEAASGAPIKKWLDGKRGWLIIIAVTIAQGLFVGIMLSLRVDARAVGDGEVDHIRDFAVEMLGYEVRVDGIHQIIPLRGGVRMTVGMELVLVLGQLPEEQVDGAERPTGREMEFFLALLGEMEPSIRSRVNGLLQRIPPDSLGSVEALQAIRVEVRDYVNDTLEQLDYGGSVRREIGKRRVTDVLIPMFIRQKS